MTPTTTRRTVYLLAWLLPVWALVAYCTGGVGWMLGPIRISSRQPLRPFLIGLAVAAWYWWKYPRADREADGQWVLSSFTRFSRMATFAVPAAVALIFFIGVRYGGFAAAGSDSYGYVSQAKLWLSGTLRVEQPWVDAFSSWTNREWLFTPLGYRPVSPDGTIVPTYPAGLPLIMALFLAVFGENGPFYVVPVCAALMLWFTYLLGRDVTGSKGVGALAVVLLVASPVFLNQSMAAMSDIPAAAGWTLVAVLALKQWSMAAGLTAGLTLLVRPNLLLLAFVPVLAWRSSQDQLIRYAQGIVPAAIAMMALNTYLYEGPLTFGYGSIFGMYALGYLPRNVISYMRWLLETQTPLILLAFVPLFVRGALREEVAGSSPRAVLGALIGFTLLSYVFYENFEQWHYLRFLLPAYPALFVLMAASVVWIAQKLPVEARVPVATVTCLAMMSFGIKLGRDYAIFNQNPFEQRHVRAAREVASRTPENAVILSVQHSGSVRYYAHRITLRYDALDAGELDSTVHELFAKGYEPYLLVDDWEQTEFQSRFAPRSQLGRLKSAPIARVSNNPEVRLFQLQDPGPAPQQ